MKRLISVWLLLSVALSAAAQHKTLFEYIREGEVSGHIRNYFMATDNHKGQDYYADAIGGLLSYESKTYKGFRLGVSGIFSYRMFSNDLNKKDALTGKSNKWERELFDVNHQENYNDLDRLEELFIKYHWKQSYITYGKIPVPYTPLINKSDGRMKPFAFQGGWAQHKRDSTTIEGGWLHKVSPRAMTEWLASNELFGLTDNGLQPDGNKASYLHHTPSSGIGIVHAGQAYRHWKADVWNVYTDKLINTAWAQLEYHNKYWRSGLIYAYQTPHSYQEKLEYNNRYVQPGENGQVLSAMVQYETKGWKLKTAYTHAFASGRFLTPRELGRDQFYTSMPRSRLDGLGNADLYAVGINYHTGHFGVDVDGLTSNGIIAGNARYNKYNLDDFYQVNIRMHYGFDRFMEGLNIDLLCVWKVNKNDHGTDLAYQKSDFNQVNLIVNYNF